jgi:hypothetical protein
MQTCDMTRSAGLLSEEIMQKKKCEQILNSLYRFYFRPIIPMSSFQTP